jgi:helicase
MLFSEWVAGTAESTKADELRGSLGLDPIPPTIARKKAYVSMLAAIILIERSNGVSVEDIERQWSLSGLDGVEESWRDTAMWLVSGNVALLDIRCFYHHLRENCCAGVAQIQKAKRVFRMMSQQGYELLEMLKYCSPLGSLIRNIKSSRPTNQPTIGIRTLRRLEAAGIRNLSQIANMDTDALLAVGIQLRYAKQIRAYVRRRLR